MSHRESCVWHPMPDEVRRSSVQSRRASLAAGRRKQMQDEPDWEVEAPPTPPPNDYSPRQEAAEQEARAEAEAKQAEQEAEAAESREPVEEARHEPVEEKSAAEAAQEREVAEAEAAAAAGEEPAAQAAEAEAEAAAAEASCEEEADGKRAKTRHTIRFRGDKWASVTDEARRKAAFEEDVADAAGLTPEQLRSLKFEVEPEMMVATFYVSHPAADRQKMREVHHKFQEASFTHTCALYPE